MAVEGIWKNVDILGVSSDKTNSMWVLVKEKSIFERKFLYTLGAMEQNRRGAGSIPIIVVPFSPTVLG